MVHISLDDFDRLTPEEYRHVWEQWLEVQESQERQAWEQTRAHAAVCVQPYSSKGISPTDIWHFPWDGEPEETKKPKAENLDPEAMKERYKAAMKNYNLK